MSPVYIKRQGLVYGNYPEVFLLSSRQDKEEFLREIRDSYLMKDILKFPLVFLR